MAKCDKDELAHKQISQRGPAGFQLNAPQPPDLIYNFPDQDNDPCPAALSRCSAARVPLATYYVALLKMQNRHKNSCHLHVGRSRVAGQKAAFIAAIRKRNRKATLMFRLPPLELCVHANVLRSNSFSCIHITCFATGNLMFHHGHVFFLKPNAFLPLPLTKSLKR